MLETAMAGGSRRFNFDILGKASATPALVPPSANTARRICERLPRPRQFRSVWEGGRVLASISTLKELDILNLSRSRFLFLALFWLFDIIFSSGKITDFLCRVDDLDLWNQRCI
jgi:hypothetical protein